MAIFAIIALFQMVCLSTARAAPLQLAWGIRNNYDLHASFDYPKLVKEGESTDHIRFVGYIRAGINIYNSYNGKVTVKYRLVMTLQDMVGNVDTYTEIFPCDQDWRTAWTTKTNVLQPLPGYMVYLLTTETLVSATIEILDGRGAYYIEGQKLHTDLEDELRRGRNLKSDLDGDGDSDILWRNTNGMVHHWNLDLGIKSSSGNVRSTAVDTQWKIVDIEDMDKDGDGDLIWMHTDGSLVIWLQENGTYLSSYNITSDGTRKVYAGSGWNFVDVEDLDDDGDGDYIWRHTDGRLKYWLIENGIVVGSGDVFGNASQSASLTNAYLGYRIEDVEDMNFDGKADIVWRDTNSASGRVITMLLNNGVFAKAQYASTDAVASSWKIVDVAEMNDDGDADIVWRNDNGTMHTWILKDGIRQSGVDMWSGHPLDSAWLVQSAVDFDGDGHGDILLRNTNGQVHGWRCVNGVRQSSFNVDSSPTGLEWTINSHR